MSALTQQTANELGVSVFSRYATLAGKEVHYMYWLPKGLADGDNKKVVVCWHGLNRNGRDFDWIAVRLAAKLNLPVICPDTIGRGFSQWAENPEFEYRLGFYHQIVTELLDALNIQKVFWIGTSMGGLIGMNAAARLEGRVERLLINDIGPEVPVEAIDRIKKYAAVPPTFGTIAEMEAFLRAAYAPIGPASDAFWRHVTEFSSRRLSDGKLTTHYDARIIQVLDADNAEAVARGESLWPTWEVYDQIKCPTLVFHGVNSDLCLPVIVEKMESRGPKPKVVHFEGIGHTPMFNNEEQFNLVVDFLFA